MEQCREDPLRHIITDGEIAVGRAPVLSKTAGSLPERTISVGQLAFATKQGGQSEGTAIEGVLGRDLNFSPAVKGL